MLIYSVWGMGGFSAEEGALSAQAGHGGPLIWEAGTQKVAEEALDSLDKALCASG